MLAFLWFGFLGQSRQADPAGGIIGRDLDCFPAGRGGLERERGGLGVVPEPDFAGKGFRGGPIQFQATQGGGHGWVVRFGLLYLISC